MDAQQLAQIVKVKQFQRLTCPHCQGDETLIAREFSFYPLPLPLAAGRLRLDIQLSCVACGALLRLRVYEVADDVLCRWEDDDPQGDAAALQVTDLPQRDGAE
jgi:hypothetical protein